MSALTTNDMLMTLDDVSRLDPHRLPRHVEPTRYHLVLEPDLVNATFDGRVSIEARVVRSTRFIVLNSADLAIETVRVDGVEVRHSLDPQLERLVLHLPRRVDPGEVSIDLTFSGILNDKLRGFYRSTYTNSVGRSRVVATTQLQSTDCRRAFPCFDEPDFKAVFAITLIVEQGDLAISNGPEIDRTWLARKGRHKIAVSFADTMPMSSYLVAFVVGPLEVTRAIDVGGVPLRIVHTPGKGDLTEFGLDVAAASLRWFDDYYGIPYPDAKIDFVALPDFAAGAMENVGCITFRESLLLVDPKTSTQMEQQNVADVVSHELAHMWFGDLVTMRWWNGIWLNEAFATFMEVAAVDDYRPEWTRWTNFSLERSVAFETDSLSSTRPVEFEVRSPQDCEGMFDVLTYQKGGALLRMLEQYLGTERFRDGIRRYLHTHSYGNTETSDLWDAIEEAVSDSGGEPVRAMMDSWIWQPGYPLVRVEIDTSATTPELVIEQSRFSFEDSSSKDEPLWIIPIHLRIGEVESKLLLDTRTARIPISQSPTSPIVVNAGGHGFYRVSYSTDLLARLSKSTLGTMATIERYTLVDDAWNAVVAGRLSAADYLEFLIAFSDERDFAVWQCIAQSLRALGRLVEGEAHQALSSRIRQLVTPALAEIGWEPHPDEGDLIGKLRGLLVTVLAVNGSDADAQERCRTIFSDHTGGKSRIHPELVAAATTVVAATGGRHEYDVIRERYLTSDNPQEQLRYLYALCEFDDPALIGETCEFAMSSNVKSQNAPFVLARCIATRRHGATAWEFVKANWSRATSSFPSNSIVRMADPVKFLNTGERVRDAQEFFDKNPIPQAAKTLEQILERHRVNARLRSREESRLGEFLISTRTSTMKGSALLNRILPGKR
ncbi:MAG: M1 family metallopeptidase [Actinomycetota bacterium]